MQRHGAKNTLRTRREFIGGSGALQENHIASILVQARPERLDSVERALTQLPGVESHGSDGAGKLILTVETGSDADLLASIRKIETADSVIAATLVYHHAEEMVDEG